jgi:uncharacterized membrane protein
MTSRDRAPTTAFTWPTVLLGVGLGGFFDGIVLHQVLQWHHLVSTRFPPDSVANLELNTLADGIFHFATWLITVLAVFVLWTELRRSDARPGWPLLLGGLLAGWGGFNVVEGVVDHQLLGIHHVRPGPDWILWDVGFLVWGALMLAAGVLLLRRATTQERANST